MERHEDSSYLASYSDLFAKENNYSGISVIGNWYTFLYHEKDRSKS